MRYLIYLILTVTTSLSAGTIHKWVDENGNVNYGDAPPNKAKSENVRVQSAPSNPGKALPRLGTSGNDTGTNKNVAAEQKRENERQTSIVCDNARQDLQVINSSSRIRLKQADGTTRFLSAEEIAERRAAAEADVDQYCN